MIEIRPTTNKEVILNILTNPTLFKLSGEVSRIEDFIVDPSYFFLEFLVDDKTAGLLKVRYLTAITVEAHIMILPEHHESGISLDIASKIIEFLKVNTQLSNLVTFVPSSCVHVIKYMRRIHFQLYGIISNGIVYNNQKNDLYCYKYEIVR